MIEISIADDAQSWRDLAPQLPANWIGQLERAEELEAAGVEPWECSRADSDALGLLFRIARGIESHRAGVQFADIPTPEWVVHADPWENVGSEDEPEWSRRLEGPRYLAVGELGQVLIEGYQRAAHGSIEWALRITGDAEDQMQPDSARKLATALVEAATFLEDVSAGGV